MRSLLLAASLLCAPACAQSATPGDTRLPAPTLSMDPPAGHQETAVFAGGCFWGIQGLFQHVKGVEATTAGYDGGSASTAQYPLVSLGTTGHAESVKVVFDPSQVSYGQLLQIFLSVGLDPTQVGGQYPDDGSQYRSILYTTTPEQTKIAQAYLEQLQQAKPFSAPIATVVEPDHGFYSAEGYHQNFLNQHPFNPYILTYDRPKIAALQRLFPDQFTQTPVLVQSPAPIAGQPSPL